MQLKLEDCRGKGVLPAQAYSRISVKACLPFAGYFSSDVNRYLVAAHSSGGKAVFYQS
jgi:hypothetical protein